MPTLTRFVVSIAVIIALIYGAMQALVHFVQPVPSNMTVKIPANKLHPVAIPPALQTVAPVLEQDVMDP